MFVAPLRITLFVLENDDVILFIYSFERTLPVGSQTRFFWEAFHVKVGHNLLKITDVLEFVDDNEVAQLVPFAFRLVRVVLRLAGDPHLAHAVFRRLSRETSQAAARWQRCHRKPWPPTLKFLSG